MWTGWGSREGPVGSECGIRTADCGEERGSATGEVSQGNLCLRVVVGDDTDCGGGESVSRARPRGPVV